MRQGGTKKLQNQKVKKNADCPAKKIQEKKTSKLGTKKKRGKS